MSETQDLEATYRQLQAQADEINRQYNDLITRQREAYGRSTAAEMKGDRAEEAKIDTELDELEEDIKQVSKANTRAAKAALEAVRAWKNAVP